MDPGEDVCSGIHRATSWLQFYVAETESIGDDGDGNGPASERGIFRSACGTVSRMTTRRQQERLVRIEGVEHPPKLCHTLSRRGTARLRHFEARGVYKGKPNASVGYRT